MRNFKRPALECSNCHAKICDWRNFPDEFDPNFIEANWPDPPKPLENCPRCGVPVDTTSAYPYVQDFPPSFALLKHAYEAVLPQWESNRQSFEKYALKFLSKSSG